MTTATAFQPRQPLDERERLSQNYASAQTMLSELSARYVGLHDELHRLKQQIEKAQAERDAERAKATELREQALTLQRQLEKTLHERTQQRPAASLPTVPQRVSAPAPAVANELNHLKAENARLQEELRQKDELLERVINSPSFKIGKGITNVVRKIPGVHR